ncbi:MAG: dTDP-glucose 4,6-dehydratase [Alphaproteobacteria bacterium]|nr:dTDP-glucose 4,6-dehydratase [Alphaproteobacteria bacterium]
MKKILITGGAGFIGSNFIPYFMKKNPDIRIVHLDKLTYAANPKYLASVNNNPGYTFVIGDICDTQLVNQLFKHYDINGVIHFAAESHVDNSISGPHAFIETNINGTFNLLEMARHHWMTIKPEYKNARFHHVSTDEVYGSLGATGLFSETTPYDPSSPYSATKAASDHLVRAYHRTYDLNVTISNCSNNYGPHQHFEKLIPTIISNCLAGKPIPIYGNGQNVRDWLYVLDHCKAIDIVFQRGQSGETYNIGGRNERTNLQIAYKICDTLDKMAPRPDGNSYNEQIMFVKDRAGHDFRYAIDASKIESQLGWRAKENFDTGIVKTIDWYLKELKNPVKQK